jgi:hypothetical protein
MPTDPPIDGAALTPDAIQTSDNATTNLITLSKWADIRPLMLSNIFFSFA